MQPFESIAKAAQNPLAFVAYLAAVASWAAIAWRVRRNKNLLANLQKLPLKDRAGALRNEFGDIPVPEDIPVDVWIRARIHRYYFLAFTLLCGVVLAIVAISMFSKSNNKPVDNSSLNDSMQALKTATQSLAENSDPRMVQRRELAAIRLGYQRPFVISKLGVPQHQDSYKTVKCVSYEADAFDAYFVFEKGTDALVFYKVTSKDGSFHPPVSAWPNGWPLDEPLCLGCKHLSEVTEMEPTRFDFSSKFWVFVESYHHETSSDNVILFLSYDDYGVDYKPDEDGFAGVPAGVRISDALAKVAHETWLGDSPGPLTQPEKAAVDYYLAHTTINSYAWLKGDYSIPDDEERETFDLEHGGHSTCPNEVVWE